MDNFLIYKYNKMAQVSNQLDYKKEMFVKPTYRMSKVLPQSGGQAFNIWANISNG